MKKLLIVGFWFDLKVIYQTIVLSVWSTKKQKPKSHAKTIIRKQSQTTKIIIVLKTTHPQWFLWREEKFIMAWRNIQRVENRLANDQSSPSIGKQSPQQWSSSFRRQGILNGSYYTAKAATVLQSFNGCFMSLFVPF